MRPRFPAGLIASPGGVDVARHAAGQTANDRPFDLAGDGLDGGEVPVADDGEARLDDIDLEAGELAGDLQLLAQIHGGAGALFAVAQCRVEYNDAVIFHNVASFKTKTPSPFWRWGLKIPVNEN